MKKWCALLAGTFGLDLALRWQGHLAAPLVPGVPLWAGLQLVSTPATGLHLTSLGAVSSAFPSEMVARSSASTSGASADGSALGGGGGRPSVVCRGATAARSSAAPRGPASAKPPATMMVERCMSYHRRPACR